MKTLINQNGLAMIETLPLVVIFTVLFSFGLGFFGVVHTAIMNSMAARTYAFETFSHRSDTILFRDRRADGLLLHHQNFGNRFHTIDPENKSDLGVTRGQFATARKIAFGRNLDRGTASIQDHNINIYDLARRNRKGGVEVSPAWIMVGYGLCINAQCGD